MENFVKNFKIFVRYITMRKKIKNEKDLKVIEYLKNYIRELQRHFDMSDRKMRIIILKVYRDMHPFSILKKIIKNPISMISFNKNKNEESV